MYYDQKRETLYVGSNKRIRKIRNGKIVGELDNNLFNDIHSLSKSRRNNLLITSTGIDSILEIDFDNPKKIIWDWFATESGYNKTPTGKTRIINRKLNYQNITTTTPEHTTHINSCLNYKKGKILATLFHQGQLVEIDMKTKKSRILLNNLKCPHHIRKRKDGYLISDTKNNRVLILDKKFNTKKIIENDYNWVQDAIELKNGDFVIGDSNNDRFIRVNKNGDELGILKMKKNTRKMFSFLTITKREAINIFGLDYSII
jgi:hypothetical protein